MNQSFIVLIEPMGAPRMTQRDKWKKRPVVLRYFAFKDKMRAACKRIMTAPATVSWTAYFPMPESWSAKKKAAMSGKPHCTKPDRDNVDKAILDALFEQDQCVATGTITKRWDDGLGARIEIFVSEGFLPEVLGTKGPGNPPV